MLSAAARTGSNRLIERLARDFRRERAKLIRKTDLRAAAKLAHEVEGEWQRASLAVQGDATRRRALKLSARQKLERMLGRSIPGFRAYQVLKKNYLKQRERIAGQAEVSSGVNNLTLSLGIFDAPLAKDVVDFVPPFTRYDMQTGDLLGLLAQDDSHILPDSGQLLQNFLFEHDESSWMVESQSTYVDHLASCGHDYVMLREGRVQVAAEIENIYNRLHFSITDNFGFSHSYLEGWVKLFVAVLRRNEPIDYHEVRLVSSLFKSEGDDKEGSLSDLSTSEPLTMGALTLRPIPEGEQITVLAGAHVRVDSDTDDMNAHVRATYWWRLRKIQVGVV